MEAKEEVCREAGDLDSSSGSVLTCTCSHNCFQEQLG